jgi:hypothetical protein
MHVQLLPSDVKADSHPGPEERTSILTQKGLE